MVEYWVSLIQKMVKIFVKCLSKKNTQLNTGVVQKQAKSQKMEHGENNMKISEEGLALIKKFEGCELEAYQCAAGIWTIAYGRIKEVKEGNTCTQEQAEAWLDEELHEYESYINDMVEVSLLQNQFDALVSWVFNLGPSNLKASTMLKVLNNKEFEEVPSQIKRWNKAGGVILGGLVKRREAEANLFESKEWSKV